MTGQVDQDIDAVGTDFARQIGVGKVRYASPNQAMRLEPFADGIALQMRRIEQHFDTVMCLALQCRQHAFKQACHRVVAQIA